MKAGDKIMVKAFMMGKESGEEMHTIEEYCYCLGIFLSNEDRTARAFTPLCELLMPGPDSEEKYIANYGSYWTNLIPSWRIIP